MNPRGTSRRIAGELRERVVSGRLASGAFLPSEGMLSEEFGASRGTVRSALAILTGEGLIESVRGRGRRVVGEPQVIEGSNAYEKIALDLKARVAEGEFSADEPLPSEAELVAAYGVSRNTVRRAYRSLTEDGIVFVRQGAGAFLR
ncbi:GntR family transcriptional regulator [Pseudonocardia sp. KRD-184]|uniref:GntR family transcriptional regulator n=1 Tax=Pseudonocardia oceani TaxID=2792013 RepID=A0ABS6UB82_9PSEU|nr:GntR family transcriptional regulator [Pseudonocardia oceani]MBW0100746.1 GntR family transcriptional regulator [Pseudonocardia oceani]MBW0108743.1 GntR family transcriptional regulator [Pseudonocardia oceani]MBW0126058.1 GntR family transcriptional regulator [Pseudonocardia oceani]MBW0129496.1 GntR family transcriptional regulator [Pseudonocardia oceani]